MLPYCIKDVLTVIFQSRGTSGRWNGGAGYETWFGLGMKNYAGAHGGVGREALRQAQKKNSVTLHQPTNTDRIPDSDCCDCSSFDLYFSLRITFIHFGEGVSCLEHRRAAVFLIVSPH
jgi:hypothetical protein